MVCATARGDFSDEIFFGLIINLGVESRRTYAQTAERLVLKNRNVSAAQVVQRGLEACEKASFHLGLIESSLDKFSVFRLVQDIPWPQIDSKELKKRVDLLRDNLIAVLGKLLPRLASLRLTQDLPDYFGQAYAVIAHETYSAMVLGKEDLFAQLFGSIFVSAFAAYNRIRETTEGYDDETRLLFSVEPITDLVHLSAYAILCSELDGLHFWTAVKRCWDQQFANAPDLLNFIRAAIHYKQSRLIMLPHDTVRTSWEQDFKGQLRARGLVEDDFGWGNVTKPHSSAIIRAVLHGGRLVFLDPESVFLAVYLADRPEIADQLTSPGAIACA